MAEDQQPKRLGRGLAALIGSAKEESEAIAPKSAQRKAPIEFLRPNPQNPRKEFASEDLDDLAASIKDKGILQPIVVRPAPNLKDVYEIIAGERRWRAAQKAGLHDVPIVVVEVDDKGALELAIIENVQRSDLNPLEEAGGYERLQQEYGYTHSEIAGAIGKSRSHVANMVRLFKLPEKSKKYLGEGKISAGHARALLALPNPDEIAERIVLEGLTVRDVERLSQPQPEAPVPGGKSSVRSSTPIEKDADTKALERRLSDALGLNVFIKARGESGEIVVRYKNLEQLDDVCARLES